ncbi:KDO2-lipid IV(A) lauroyltransferase [Neolewinella xylanilytica]|uniref:KDO2-lipid IV(A) lauroyltransferase n=1 Tax=Neolewinella xylanilytica TaxID=1514080 RepID=A0A2S6I3X8_9BACT|nr:KDO2-lipid IV(A) lauroyltransferase [Neolewinella xylanilytica]
MAYLLYYLVFIPLSYLPWSVMYGVSAALEWLNWHLVGYRKAVVVDNIRRSFPAYTEREVTRLARDYYGFFFDSVAESVKLFSMSEGAAVRRCRVVNPEVVDHLRVAGRSFIAYGAHFSNWEIAALSFQPQFAGFQVMGIYSPLNNAVLDRLFRVNRGRTGTQLVSRRVVQEYFDTHDGTPTVEFFVADQSPSNARWQKLHWTEFLGRTTAFLAGPERYAVRHDRPVYYMNLRRQGRGYYTAKLIPITDEPRETEPGFITECFARRLEHEIRRDPATWLWSHRRWKRGVPDRVAELLRTKDHLPPEYDPEG